MKKIKIKETIINLKNDDVTRQSTDCVAIHHAVVRAVVNWPDLGQTVINGVISFTIVHCSRTNGTKLFNADER